MTREDIVKKALALKGKNWLFELPTSTGKSRIALEKVKQLSGNKGNMLIVVPRNAHKGNWAEEIKRWWSDCQLDITYTTYVSFPKYAGEWDFVIYDEVHHLSERCQDAMMYFKVKHSILCSATVGRSMRRILQLLFNYELTIYKKELRSIIDEDILPDPKIYLCPLHLKDGEPTEAILKDKGNGKMTECNWNERWQFLKKRRLGPLKIKCNEQQYYEELDSMIHYWKNRYLRIKTEASKNRWLRLCSDRLRWLSDKKLPYLQKLLPKLENYRTLVFCNSIEQTELLGKYCINSKNAEAMQYLEDFNKGRINHITACNILNESMNLVNCQIGIYANLNNSETIVKQRLGRLLRHPNPIIIVPYFENTREEELVNKMIVDYNPLLIKRIKSLDEIEL